MPGHRARFKPRAEILSYEEIERFARIVAALGVNRFRLTGGEPLVRADLPALVHRLAGIPGLADLALTTNGVLLAEHAAALKHAGLRRVNVSLDAMSEDAFKRIARRAGLDQVLQGIRVAQRLGFAKIRLNAVAIRGVTDDQIVPLADFARSHALELRFIGFMPLDADSQWQAHQVLGSAEIRGRLESHFGPLREAERPEPSQPAAEYVFADGSGRIGFIDPVTQPFCAACNRLRITADGSLKNCLFEADGRDVRALLRSRATDQEIADLVRASVEAKNAGHNMSSPQFIRPKRAMYQLGG